MPDRYQVIIVGGGPVGLALAADLGQRGVTCALVEAHHEPQRIPKGQNLTQRSLEHFYFWNCVEELRAARPLPGELQTSLVTVYESLDSEYRYSIDRTGAQRYFFQKNERLPQYLTESVLRARVLALESVTCLYGHTVKEVRHDSSGVAVVAAAAAWPYDERTLEADYVVGCDGGRSLVRSRAGIEVERQDLGRRMVLTVFTSAELSRRLEAFPPATTYRVLSRRVAGYWQFFGRVDTEDRWFFHAPVPQDKVGDLDTDEFHALVEAAAGLPFSWEVEHAGLWDLRIDIASSYSSGRCLIAGDACHTHPPYGGHGLNTGLEDAANLGWKLAATLAGWGGDHLLDSYEAERRPVFVDTGKLITDAMERDRAFLESSTPTGDLATFERAWEQQAEQDRADRIGYEPNYDGSPIVVSDSPAAQPGVHGRHSVAARAGHHLCPAPLTSGENVFEQLGSEFALLAFGVDDRCVEDWRAAAASLQVPLRVVRDSFDGGRELYECPLVLVRPDQYVAWAGADDQTDAEAILQTAAGHR